MKKQIPSIIALALITGWVVFAGTTAPAQPADSLDQSAFPMIIAQPTDQCVPLGSSATFTVVATNGPLTYQWLREGVPIAGQTNSSLTIANAQISDVAHYSCNVSQGLEVVPTRAASLMVYTSDTDPQTGIDPITVFGAPSCGSGTQGTCPGAYIGYVVYANPTTNAWGWAPQTNTTVYTATDTNRINTNVQYVGAYGDIGCNKTTVTIPYPAFSPVYRFAIFFTNNVPTNAYPITLVGFNP
jgi:hypothetical protein